MLDLKSSSEQIFCRKLSLGAPDVTVPTMFCHAITTACLAFAFLITGFRFLVTVYSKGKKMDIHISVNITIRNMFMSCRQVALSK